MWIGLTRTLWLSAVRWSAGNRDGRPVGSSPMIVASCAVRSPKLRVTPLFDSKYIPIDKSRILASNYPLVTYAFFRWPPFNLRSDNLVSIRTSNNIFRRPRVTLGFHRYFIRRSSVRTSIANFIVICSLAKTKLSTVSFCQARVTVVPFQFFFLCLPFSIRICFLDRPIVSVRLNSLTGGAIFVNTSARAKFNPFP